MARFLATPPEDDGDGRAALAEGDPVALHRAMSVLTNPSDSEPVWTA